MKLQNLIQLFLRFLSLFAAIFVFIKGLDSNLSYFSIPLIFLFNFYQIFSSRHHILVLLIVFVITYCNYSFIYANYISPVGSAYTEQINQTVSNTSLNTVLLFTCVMMWLTNWKSIPQLKVFSFINRNLKSDSLIIISVFVLILIFFIGFERPNVIGMRGRPRPIYEYSLILFLFYFIYCGDKKKYKRLGAFLIIFFSLQNFVFGGRILGIQFLLCLYVVLYINAFSTKKVIAIMVVGIFLMNIIGIMRGQLLYQHISLNSVLIDIINDGGTLDTAYSAYYTSQSFVYTSDFLSYQERLFLFGKFISGIFFGTESQYLLQNVTKDYVEHSNGGVLPLYFYLYLGPMGFLLSNLLLSFYLSIVTRVNSNSSVIVKCLAVYVTCHSFRWYLYTPNGLLRGVLFLLFVYLVYSIGYKLLPKKL